MKMMKHGCWKNRWMMLAAALGFAMVCSGCSPWSTYPEVEVKAATKMTKPTWEPVPSVIAAAVHYARDHFTPNEDLAVNLPESTPAEVYEKVFAKLGYGRPLLNPADRAIHIREVRTRGFDGQVDLVYARADGMNQLVTITLARSVLESWRVTDSRPWQLRNFAAPQPNYVPPPIVEEKTEPTEPAPGEAPQPAEDK